MLAVCTILIQEKLNSLSSLCRLGVYILGLGLTTALLPSTSSAQESDFGNWLIYIGSKDVGTKWNIHHEVQYRNYNFIGDLEQLLLRTGVGYDLTDNANVLLGYGFIHSQNYVDGSEEKAKVDEHRIFQQFITKSKIGSVGLQHRYRFEQRFVSDDFKLRFRYFLGVSVPLKFKEYHKLYLSAYNELFLNTEGNIFDRNRLYLGLGHKLNDKLKVEAGYMTQMFQEGSRDQLNIFLFASF